MAKALFHKNQRVYVKPVGTWALIERVIPHWVKDVPEPLRVTYDVGLGREFTAAELVTEVKTEGRLDEEAGLAAENWRIFRMKNRWQGGEETGTHPYPGTFPVIMTDDNDWGGWRVPGSEYDRDPARIEHQARLIVNSPQMLHVVRQLVQIASESANELPSELVAVAKQGASIVRNVYEAPPTERQLAAE